MKYIKLFESFDKDDDYIVSSIRDILIEGFDSKIIFVRTRKFDNTGTARKLSYDGVQCWCISENDLDKYIEELELWGGNRNDVEIIDTIGYDIYALNYPKTHKYIMGEADELPELEPFNEEKHRMKYIKQGEKSIIKYVSELGTNELCYQIILKKV